METPWLPETSRPEDDCPCPQALPRMILLSTVVHRAARRLDTLGGTVIRERLHHNRFRHDMAVGGVF
jgi:hypothetical protein